MLKSLRPRKNHIQKTANYKHKQQQLVLSPINRFSWVIGSFELQLKYFQRPAQHPDSFESRCINQIHGAWLCLQDANESPFVGHYVGQSSSQMLAILNVCCDSLRVETLGLYRVKLMVTNGYRAFRTDSPRLHK